MRTKLHLFALLLTLWVVTTALHPFYVGVTQVKIIEGKEVNMEVRLFTDDLQKSLLKKGITFSPLEVSDSIKKQVEVFLLEYVKLNFKTEGLAHTWVPVKLQLVGYEKEEDATWFYLELTRPLKKSAFKWKLQNTLLMDDHDEQVHIVHAEKGSLRVSEQLNKNRRLCIF
jgi:hypothetical protein